MTQRQNLARSGVHWLSFTDKHKSRVSATTERYRSLFESYRSELVRFNQSHNLISRSAENHAFEYHILHCLSLACFDFPQSEHVVDWGSGGGLPAIPLAIVFPEISVTAVDKVNKKMQTVATIARRLSLSNVSVFHGLAAEFVGSANYSVSRATAPLSTLWQWHMSVEQRARTTGAVGRRDRQTLSESGLFWPPGLICLKGGDLRSEIDDLMGVDSDILVSGLRLDGLYEDPHYVNKYILHVQRWNTQ